MTYQGHRGLAAAITPVSDFPQTGTLALLEQSHAMTTALKLMDVGPYLGPPRLIVNRHLPTGGAAGVILALPRLPPGVG